MCIIEVVARNSNRWCRMTKKVKITKGGFSPKSVEVGKGGSVEWTNDDTAPHTVTWDAAPTGTAPPSGDIPPDGTHTLKFDTAGTFTYRDEHGTAAGEVKVA